MPSEVLSIDPLSSLSSFQRELLHEALIQRPDVAFDSLVVYRLGDGAIVAAPRTPGVKKGTFVVATGLTAVVVSNRSGAEGRNSVHFASALVPFGQN